MCGTEAQSEAAPSIAVAGMPPPATIGLGDWTEQLLAGIGVTQERYLAAKKFAGLAPTCDCDERKAWLNKVSDWWRGEAPPP